MNFFSAVSPPKYVPTDQGTNFTSKLSIHHRTSSSYHPQSQGTLEHFHQMIKSIMEKYCLETGKDWDKGLLFLLLAARETVQDSTGFSPAQLVFGHIVRVRLRLLHEKFLSDTASPNSNVLDYVSLGVSQEKIKVKFDKKSCEACFSDRQQSARSSPTPQFCFSSKVLWPLCD